VSTRFGNGLSSVSIGVLGQIDQPNRRTAGCYRLRNGLPDAARRPGNQCYFTGKRETHRGHLQYLLIDRAYSKRRIAHAP
jgi:hypothetical protein